jgi:BolA family transcriptional regulator, general stress-responsive regulator
VSTAAEHPTIQAMRSRLAPFEPDVVEIYDESAQHAGHTGAQGGGGHYQLLLVSRRFEGQPRIARHRMVYDALADLMGGEIHALSITAYTPEELGAAFPA